MREKALYSIGQVSKICDVSHRMLRYYEEIGLVGPDRIAEPSHYRYYSVQTMRRVQCIRYLIDEGFQLEEIKEMMESRDLDRMEALFLKRIQETEEEIRYGWQRLDSLRAWYALVVEGRTVHRHKHRSVTVKYIPRQRYFYYERVRTPGERDSDAYLETEYFTRSKQNGHAMVDMGGAFYMKYDSITQRLDDSYGHMTLLQTVYPHSRSEEDTADFGGFMALSAYHLGSDRTIADTYRTMIDWAEKHSFALQGECFERHVLDIYSTDREEDFVTELLLPVEEETPGLDRVMAWKEEK